MLEDIVTRFRNMLQIAKLDGPLLLNSTTQAMKRSRSRSPPRLRRQSQSRSPSRNTEVQCDHDDLVNGKCSDCGFKARCGCCDKFMINDDTCDECDRLVCVKCQIAPPEDNTEDILCLACCFRCTSKHHLKRSCAWVREKASKTTDTKDRKCRSCQALENPTCLKDMRGHFPEDDDYSLENVLLYLEQDNEDNDGEEYDSEIEAKKKVVTCLETELRYGGKSDFCGDGKRNLSADKDILTVPTCKNLDLLNFKLFLMRKDVVQEQQQQPSTDYAVDIAEAMITRRVPYGETQVLRLKSQWGKAVEVSLLGRNADLPKIVSVKWNRQEEEVSL